MKLIRIITCAFLLVIPFYSISVNQAAPVVLMGNIDFMPYEGIDRGQLTGMNVDLLREIEKTINQPIQIQLQPWAQSQQRINNGEGDGVTMLARTAERELLFDFSHETFAMRFSLFVQRKNISLISIDNLNGRKIAVKQGGFPASLLNKHDSAITAVYVNSVAEGFELLLNGDVEGVLEHEQVGYHWLNRNHITGVQAINTPLATRPIYIALHKGNSGLLAAINAAIEQIKSNGRYEKILNDWSGERIILVKHSDVKTYSFILAGIFSALLLLVTYGLILRYRERQKVELLESLATTDKHTLLANRQCFERQVCTEWHRMQREEKALALILFEIDGLPRNTANMKEIADLLKNRLLRPGDLAANYGNGTFSVLLPNTNKAGAAHVAESLHRAIATLVLTKAKDKNADYITINLGLASMLPNSGHSLDMLVKAAKDAINEDKFSVKHRFLAPFNDSGNPAPPIALSNDFR